MHSQKCTHTDSLELTRKDGSLLVPACVLSFLSFLFASLSLSFAHFLAIVTTATYTLSVCLCDFQSARISSSIYSRKFASLSSCEFKTIHTHFHDKRVNEWMQKNTTALLLLFLLVSPPVYLCGNRMSSLLSLPLSFAERMSLHTSTAKHTVKSLMQLHADREKGKNSPPDKWIPENQSVNVCTSNAHLIEVERKEKRKHKVSSLLKYLMTTEYTFMCVSSLSLSLSSRFTFFLFFFLLSKSASHDHMRFARKIPEIGARVEKKIIGKTAATVDTLCICV